MGGCSCLLTKNYDVYLKKFNMRGNSLNALEKKKVSITEKERHVFIDKACGISILLVVYGHIYFPETIGIGWYINSQKFIYKFHMPLFMCISGYLVFLTTSKKNIKTKEEYLNFQ